MNSTPSLLLAFLAGMLTVATPCVFPLIPIIIGSSLGGMRPLSIVAGMAFTFTVMGLMASVIGSVLPTEYLRWFSIAFIIGMGVVLFDEELNREYSALMSRAVGRIGDRRFGKGVLGGLGLGMSLGIVWIPCVGPILGSILAYAAQGSDPAYGALLLLTYAIGVGIPMLVIAYSGRKLSGRVKPVHLGAIKKLAGVLMVLAGLMMLFGIDKYIQRLLLPYMPAYL